MHNTRGDKPWPAATVPVTYTRVTKTLRPLQPGSLKLSRRYGDALVCVRYREDALGRHRCTTVELVVDEGPVQPRLNNRLIVWVKIPAHAQTLRERAAALGATWDPSSHCWRMSLRTARSLQLQDRIRFTDKKLPRLGKPG